MHFTNDSIILFILLHRKKNLLFIGNRGVGKSTLLNCIMNKRFRGELREDQLFGISTQSNMIRVADTTYMSRESLDDEDERKKTAEAITEALKNGGKYQIVFVVTLEAGRVRPADVATMTLVLESANEITHYGVIFNNLEESVLREIKEGNLEMEFLTQVSIEIPLKKPVPVPLFLGYYAEHNVITCTQKLEEFLLTLFPIKIKSENVGEISTDNYQALKIKLEKELSFLKENNKAMQKKMEEDEEYFSTRLSLILIEQKGTHEDETKQLKENHKGLVEQMEQQVQQTNEDVAISGCVLKIEDAVNLKSIEKFRWDGRFVSS